MTRLQIWKHADANGWRPPCQEAMAPDVARSAPGRGCMMGAGVRHTMERGWENGQRSKPSQDTLERKKI